jgi:hypothetical protein
VPYRVYCAIVGLVVTGCTLSLLKKVPEALNDAGASSDSDGPTCVASKQICFKAPVQTRVSWGLTSVTVTHSTSTEAHPSVVVAAYGSSEVVQMRVDVTPFEELFRLNVGQAPWQAVVGDFALDGSEDCLVASPGSATQLGKMSLWHRKSGQQWSSLISQIVGAGTYALSVRTDPVAKATFAIAASYDAQTLLPLSSYARAAPIAGQSMTVDLKPTATAFADGDSGANRVFVVGTNKGGGGLRVYNMSGNQLALAASSQSFGSSPNDLKVGDINGDSRLDAIVVDDSDTSALYSLVNDGRGAWSVAAKLDLPPHSHAAALADYDRDGHLDVASISGSTVSIEVCFGDGSGKFGNCTAVPHALQQPSDIAALDIDSDGWTDLVALGYEGTISGIHVSPASEQ